MLCGGKRASHETPEHHSGVGTTEDMIEILQDIQRQAWERSRWDQ